MVLWIAALIPENGASAQAGDAKDKPGTRQDAPKGYAIPAAPPLAPAEALAAFVVEPGLRIELAAAEPEVVAPVSIQFDADGRMWVVEMRGYMPDVGGSGERTPNGAIAVLEDRDDDGRFETRTTFLDGLVLPRAVCVLAGGALVLAPPRLLWCPDRDGDLRADASIEQAAGLGGLESPEHAPNGLLWALDNRIYLAKHDACYRWAGDGLRTEASPPLGQWGISQDDVGRLFYNDNSTHLRVDLLPRQLASANPHQGRAAGLDHVPCRDQAVWPLRVTPGVNRGYQPGVLEGGKLTRFTAACSPMIYRGEVLAAYRGGAFVCEPAANLVRCDVVRDEDGVLVAEPFARGREVLASHDERFRPVALAEGPDGAVYVADMARGVIQHRLFVTTFLRRQIEERKLETPLDRGRVWRLTSATATGRRERVQPSRAPWADLVAMLAHPAGYFRDRAQQQLILRGEVAAVPALAALVRQGEGLPALHALWTLHGLGALPRAVLYAAVFAPDARLRAAAYEIAAVALAQGSDTILAGALRQRAGDEREPRAARMLALAMGRVQLAGALAALCAMVERFSNDELLPAAALAGLAGRELDLLRAAVASGVAQQSSTTALLALAAAAIVRRGNATDLLGLLELVRSPAGASWQGAALLEGCRRGVPRGAGGSVRAGSLGRDPNVRAAAAALSGALAAPRRAVWEPLALAFRVPESAAEGPALTADERASFERGRTLYVVCAGCHGSKGEGTGEGPPLAASARVGGPPASLARIVLHGLEGPIDVGGQRWERAMPRVALDDGDIAAVLTYVRVTFAQQAPVTPAFVAGVRAASAGRDRPWTAAELEAR